MDKDALTAALIEQIQRHAANVTVATAADARRELTRLFDLLESLQAVNWLPPAAAPTTDEPAPALESATAPAPGERTAITVAAAPAPAACADEIPAPADAEPLLTLPDPLVAGWRDERAQYIGRFRRSLTGGYLDQAVRVPEGCYRRMVPQPENGDWVRAVPSEYAADGAPTRYDFTWLKSAPLATPVRTAEFLPLQYRADLRSHVVEFSDPAYELPVIATVREEDIARFRLAKGDYVDWSYYVGKETTGGVAWKYSAYDAEAKRQALYFHKRAQAAAASAKPKPRVADAPAPRHPRPKQVLREKTVLLVAGDDSNVAPKFRAMVMARGGELHLLGNRDSTAALQARIRHADFVVIYTQESSHQHMWDAKAYADKRGVPSYFAKTSDVKNFLNSYHRAVNKLALKIGSAVLAPDPERPA
ncbi:DUF2325 domain-containing protein [Lacticaseibacillus kribbianus]|uniref:DUF2325 domain-containing protein n=1 Tax=Lacticaseibacillus kribbianus TaxID=2926292 RepID=UPI001CD2FE93|nr:DUF2325 domain-containing protein [Lacticaseibacillus kribbianus]